MKRCHGSSARAGGLVPGVTTEVRNTPFLTAVYQNLVLQWTLLTAGHWKQRPGNVALPVCYSTGNGDQPLTDDAVFVVEINCPDVTRQ